MNNGHGQNHNFANIIEGGGGKGGTAGKAGKGNQGGDYKGFTNPWKNSSIKQTPASIILMFLIQFFGFYLMF